MSSSSKQQLTIAKVVEQLQYEIKIDRIPVSTSAQEMVDFCIKQEEFDYLVHKQGPNPFKPEKPCPVI